jgi:DNA mismatch repair protein MutL
LLEGISFQLSPESAFIFEEKLPLLKTLGFQVETFGPAAFLIRAIPNVLTGIDPVAVLRGVVEEFEEDETPLEHEVENRLIARICKRAAVRGGMTLAVEEQTALLRDLELCQSPRTCPHGRPTMIHLPVSLLERQFGRQGAR